MQTGRGKMKQTQSASPVISRTPIAGEPDQPPQEPFPPASLRGRLEKLSFVQLLIPFVAMRLPWIFTVPMVEAPDEFAHYWVIRFLREHWRLPLASEVHAGGPSAVYGSLPQMGYLPHLLACSAGPVEWIPLLSRFGSLAMGVVLLFATWKCSRILFAKQPLLAVALPLTVLLHPQMIFLHCYANCDATSTALSAVQIWLMLETLRTGLTIKRTAVMGLLAGWLALTKYSALAILPVLALAVVSSCVLHGTALSTSLTAIGCGSALAVAVSGWWFWRNALEFNGDVLGTKTMYNTWATTFHRQLHYYLSPWRIIKDVRWWRMMFFSFWGMFGYMNKYMWRPAYIAYIGYLILAAAGVTAIVCHTLRQLLPGRNVLGSAGPGAERNEIANWNEMANSGSRTSEIFSSDPLIRKQARINLTMWVCLSLVAVINLASMIWASTQNLGGPQGRYLFNSEIPVLALMLAGLHKIPRAGDKVVISFVGFNLVVAVAVFVWLFLLYGGFRLSPL